jgi:hypothetical protein
MTTKKPAKPAKGASTPGTVPKSAARPQPKGGSRKGVPNKATANAREAIARFVDGNSDRLQGWLDEIAADEKQGAKAAMQCFLEVLEYHVPKLARVEHAGEIKHGVVIQATPHDEAL